MLKIDGGEHVQEAEQHRPEDPCRIDQHVPCSSKLAFTVSSSHPLLLTNVHRGLLGLRAARLPARRVSGRASLTSDFGGPMISERDCPLFFRAPGLGAVKTLKGVRGALHVRSIVAASSSLVVKARGDPSGLAQVAESIVQGRDCPCHRVPLGCASEEPIVRAGLIAGWWTPSAMVRIRRRLRLPSYELR